MVHSTYWALLSKPGVPEARVSPLWSAMNWKAARWRRTPRVVIALVSFAGVLLPGSGLGFGLPAYAGVAARTDPIRTIVVVTASSRLREPNAMLCTPSGGGGYD